MSTTIPLHQRKGLTLLLLVIFFIAVSVSNAFAQNGTIKGKVFTTDQKTAMGVSVGLEGTTLGGTTDEKGAFIIPRVKPGSYTLKVQMIGMQPQEQQVTVEPGKSTQVSLTLSESAAQLQEVVVVSQRAQKFKADKPSESLRLQTPLLEVPQNIQVITGDLLKDQQVFDLLDGVSRNVSGVITQEHWGNYAPIYMRGARVAPFRNGMNIQSTWGPLSEDMSFVDRIEFVKGPAGFMLANGDPAGFYNVVTKKPTGVNRQDVSLTYGSYNLFRGTVDLDGALTNDGKLQYRLNVIGQKKDSWRDYEYNKRYAIVPVLKYQFNDKTSLTAEYTYQFMRSSVLGSAYSFSGNSYADQPVDATLAEPGLEPTDMKDHSVFLTFEHKFNDNWKVTAQAAYFKYTQEGSSLWISGKPEVNGDIYRYTSLWDASNDSKFGQVFVNGHVQTGGITHKILGGLDYGNKKYLADWGQSIMIDGADTPFNIYNPVHGRSSISAFDRSIALKDRAGVSTIAQEYGAAYVQDELGFLDDKIRLTLAGRYTKAETQQYTNTTHDEKFTPRVGLSVSLSKSISVYGLYDQAFQPQVGELTSGKPVKAMTGNSLEAGIKKDWLNGRWNSSISIYKIDRDNSLFSDPGSITGKYVQVGYETKGVEVDVRGEIATGLNLNVNYAYTDSEIAEVEFEVAGAAIGSKTPGFAKHINNTWLSYRLQKGMLEGLGLSVGYQWQVDRYGWGFTQGSEQDLPNYFRLDGAASYQFRKFNVALNVNNLLNKYLYAGAHTDFDYDKVLDGYYWQTEAPRNFRVTVGYKF